MPYMTVKTLVNIGYVIYGASDGVRPCVRLLLAVIAPATGAASDCASMRCVCTVDRYSHTSFRTTTLNAATLSAAERHDIL